MSKMRILALSIFCILFLSGAAVSYAYVEPARPVLVKRTPTELTNPDLPRREGIKLGEITLHAAVSAGVTIDPNIYLARRDETYDVVTLGRASIGVEVPFKEHKISLDYEAAEDHYNRFQHNDHLDQRARALIKLEFTDYRVIVSEVFRNFSELPGAANTVRLHEDDNAVRVGVTRETEKFAFDIGYSNLIHHYNSDDIIFSTVTYKDRNSMSHVCDISVGYKFLPKTSLIIENDYGISEHESGNSPDYYFEELLVGLKGDLHKNLTTDFQAGYHYQYFKSSPIFFDDTAAKFICRGGFKYTMTDKDIMDFTFERSVNDSTYQNLTYYTTDFAGVAYTHVLTPKITGRMFGTYQRNMYPAETTEVTDGNSKTAKRRDNSYGVGFSLRYDIQRWLSCEFGYQYKRAVSNFHTFDYEDGITSFKITAGF